MSASSDDCLPREAIDLWVSVLKGKKISGDRLLAACPGVLKEQARAVLRALRHQVRNPEVEKRLPYTLARFLKSCPGLGPGQIEPAVNLFRQVAVAASLIGDGHLYPWNDPDAFFGICRKIFKGTKLGFDADPLGQAVKDAKNAPITLSPEFLEQIGGRQRFKDDLKTLASVCYRLQMVMGDKFSLSQEQAGCIFGKVGEDAKDYGKALLGALEDLVVHTGNEPSRHKRRAKEYRFQFDRVDLYVPPDGSHTPPVVQVCQVSQFAKVTQVGPSHPRSLRSLKSPKCLSSRQTRKVVGRARPK